MTKRLDLPAEKSYNANAPTDGRGGAGFAGALF